MTRTGKRCAKAARPFFGAGSSVQRKQRFDRDHFPLLGQGSVRMKAAVLFGESERPVGGSGEQRVVSASQEPHLRVDGGAFRRGSG